MQKSMLALRRMRRQFYDIRRHLFFYKRDGVLIKGGGFSELTDDEVHQIKETWPCFPFYRRIDSTWYQIYKREHGFSPFFVDAMQVKYLYEICNPPSQTISLVNKALADVFFPQLPFPEVYVRSLNGTFFDSQLNVISIQDAVNILSKEGSFIIKPSLETKSGQGVVKIHVDNNICIKDIILNAGQNFIIQEAVQQEKTIASFNPTSVNCCRLTTIYLDGHYAYSPMIKIGKKGSNVDNWHSSYLVGVSKDGIISSWGYDNKLNRVFKCDNGVEFAGVKIPGFEKMLETVEYGHKKCLPHCGVVGWDILVDAKGDPIVLEYNISSPGVVGEQLASGTFFEEFRDIIVDRVKRKF